MPQLHPWQLVPQKKRLLGSVRDGLGVSLGGRAEASRAAQKAITNVGLSFVQNKPPPYLDRGGLISTKIST